MMRMGHAWDKWDTNRLAVERDILGTKGTYFAVLNNWATKGPIGPLIAKPHSQAPRKNLRNSAIQITNSPDRVDFRPILADTYGNCSLSDKPQGLRRGYFLRSCYAAFAGWEVSHAR